MAFTRDDGLGDLTRKAVGRTVFGLDRGDVIRAECDRFTRGRDDSRARAARAQHPTCTADVPPTSCALVRSATTAESIAWSKWVCTGTASNRSTPMRARHPSMRGSDGEMRRSATAARLGREKKPSVISADEPSSISSVVTPAHVTVSGESGAAAGTSK